MSQKRNPFEVLGLDPSVTEEAVVRRAALLLQRASGEDELTAVREAAQALTGSAETRALHAFLTHPAPGYPTPELTRFVARNRRPPQPGSDAAAAPAPEPDLTEVAALVRGVLAVEMAPSPLPFECPDLSDPAEEIARQDAEAAWQVLLHTPGC